jgi:TetR/AcrR family transcriptional regulator, transcriptional repressor for nem operon
MRKSREEAAETRRHIVNTAAAEFRRNGIKATGLAELMAAAGLTPGGFYRHFESKEQLVAEACAQAVESIVREIDTWSHEKGGLETVLTRYLSGEHRDHPEQGCPFASMGSELARSDDQTRRIATDGFVKLIEILAKRSTELKPSAAKARAVMILSALIGALMMSRVVTDTELSDTLLRQSRKQLLELCCDDGRC